MIPVIIPCQARKLNPPRRPRRVLENAFSWQAGPPKRATSRPARKWPRARSGRGRRARRGCSRHPAPIPAPRAGPRPERAVRRRGFLVGVRRAHPGRTRTSIRQAAAPPARAAGSPCAVARIPQCGIPRTAGALGHGLSPIRRSGQSHAAPVRLVKNACGRTPAPARPRAASAQPHACRGTGAVPDVPQTSMLDASRSSLVIA